MTNIKNYGIKSKLKMFNSKKAQVTIFIIVGIILILGVGTFLLYRSNVINFGDDQNRVTVTVPQEYQPLKSFIDSCLRETAISGLQIAGTQGGYIYPEENGLSVGNTPTTGNAVTFIQDTNVLVPYWNYLSSPDTCEHNCVFASEMPELKKRSVSASIEDELEKYVDRNIETCFDDFTSFKSQGYQITELSSPETMVTVASSTVNFLLQYEIKAERSGSESTDITGSYVSIPLNLEKIYNLARDITSLEQEYTFIERHMVNLIYGYSALDKNKLPPPSDTDFDLGGGISWKRSFVEGLIPTYVLSPIKLLQVPNSRNYEVRVAETENQNEYLNRGTNVPIAVNNANELPDYRAYNINFQYIPPELGWETYFNINCDSMCQSQSATSNIAALIGIQRYKFFYAISAPILISIDSPDELKNELQGYKFQFMLEANVRDNTPMKADYRRLVGAQAESNNIGLCDEDKRNTGDITINLKNSVTNEAIDEMTISYACFEESCQIGQTNAEGELIAKFPTCVGGIMHFLKEGYQQKSIPFSAILDEPAEISQSIDPLKEMNIVLKKKNLIKYSGWTLSDTAVELDSYENASIIFTKSAGPTELEYTTGVNYDPAAINIVPLAPGRYNMKIDVFMTKIDVINIPKDERGDDDEEYTLPEIKANDTTSGGADITIDISADDLKKSTITVYAIGIDPRILTNHEDMEIISKFYDYSSRYRQNLLPEYS